MAFVAPHLAKAWQLSQVQVGYLLSAGVFGMALGAVFVSPLADRIGRRRHVILCLALITVGMTLSVFATDVPQMVIFRAAAGIFIGALVSSLNITVSEYCSDQRRGVVMGLYGIGFPLGAALGGAASAVLIAKFGWQAPFALGAIMSAIMLVVAWLLLPESIDYLVEQRPAGALEQYNRIAARLGYEQVQALPARTERSSGDSRMSAIFGGIMGRRTALLWTAFALLTSAFYFANTWTAKLLADVTNDPALGVRAGVLVPLGGVLGAVLFAGLAALMRPRLATAVVMFGGAAAFITYAAFFGNVNLAIALALVVGTFANGGIAAFYAISPTVYSTSARATGVGWMMGAARCVSIATPILVGYLLSSGWKPTQTYQLFAGALALAGVCCLLLDLSYRKQPTDAPIAEGARS